MNRNLPAAIARRIYARLPNRLRGAARRMGTRPLYTLNTSGLQANSEMVAWAQEHRRPVSIVIPSYNDLPLLTTALASIEQTCGGFDLEIIIVDDYCQPENSRALKALETDRIRVVLKEERLGFAGTVNIGMEQARYDIVLLNSDIVAKPGWLEALQYSAYAIDPKIGMVSPKLVYPDGRIQYGGTYWARVLAPQWFGHLHVGSPATKPAANVAGYNRSVSGACVYVTREAFERVGVLDAEYWLGFEDVDYGLSAWQNGVRCFYQPAAMLVHHESASRGYSQGWRELASMRKFWRRWSDDFMSRQADPTRVDFIVGPGSHALWAEYAEGLVAGLAEQGFDAVLHRTEASGVDEPLVESLAERGGLIVACDWSVAQTVWLATIGSGKPVYLLPTVESGAFPADPARQASIIAGYRPEFEYLAPNRWTQAQLQAEAAWESRGRIVPALGAEPVGADLADRELTITIGATSDERARVDSVVRSPERVVHLDRFPADRAALGDLRDRRPRAIVSFVEAENSLVPLALMSVGAAYLSRANPRTTYEVLDGYNALLFDQLDGLSKSLSTVLENDEVHRELAGNGELSAARVAESARHGIARALRSIAETSL
jgi:GT2 family glycosyltransferase